MEKVKKKVKMLVGETDAAYIFREKIKVKALKITETLIQAI